MITINSKSPIDPNTLEDYYLNEPTFKGTELWYSDVNEFNYVMILRFDPDSANIYDIVYYERNDGEPNSSATYDYRFDFSNFIEIVRPTIQLNKSGQVYYMYYYNPVCKFFILIDKDDFMLDPNFLSLVYNESNNDMYMFTNDIIYNVNVDNNLEVRFSDYLNQSLKATYDSELYKGTYYCINLRIATVTYLTAYDTNGNVIIQYTTDFTNVPYKIRTLFYPIPENTSYIIFDVTYDSQHHYIRKDVIDICVKNQYFYYGLDNPIESICFSGKRNKVEQTTKQNIVFGRRERTVNMFIQEKYLQNTGLNMIENKLFDMAKSPYLFEIVDDAIQEWVIDEGTFEGFNTKSFGNRNVVLNLSKRSVKERYTGFYNGFYN